MADLDREQQRAELYRGIWNIANGLRGSVDGWDFKQYVLGMLFYRYISENLTKYINDGEHAAGDTAFNYAELSDEPVILYGFTHSTPLTMILTLAKSLTNYLQFYEPFVDKWHKGAYKVSDLNVTEPVPQISEWEND